MGLWVQFVGSSVAPEYSSVSTFSRAGVPQNGLVCSIGFNTHGFGPFEAAPEASLSPGSTNQGHLAFLWQIVWSSPKFHAWVLPTPFKYCSWISPGGAHHKIRHLNSRFIMMLFISIYILSQFNLLLYPKTFQDYIPTISITPMISSYFIRTSGKAVPLNVANICTWTAMPTKAISNGITKLRTKRWTFGLAEAKAKLQRVNGQAANTEWYVHVSHYSAELGSSIVGVTTGKCDRLQTHIPRIKMKNYTSISSEDVAYCK